MALPNKAIQKQAYEAFYIAGSILRVQTDTEVIVLGSSSVVAEDKDGNDVTSTLLQGGSEVLGTDPKGAFADNQLEVRLQSGSESASPYKVTFRMETDEGNKWEVDREVEVTET